MRAKDLLTDNGSNPKSALFQEHTGKAEFLKEKYRLCDSNFHCQIMYIAKWKIHASCV